MNEPTNFQIRDRLNLAKSEPCTGGLALELMPLMEIVLDRLEADEAKLKVVGELPSKWRDVPLTAYSKYRKTKDCANELQAALKDKSNE